MNKHFLNSLTCLIFTLMPINTIFGHIGRPTIKPINNALYLGTPEVFNTTFDDCIWKRLDEIKEICTDEDVSIIMYTSGEHVYKTLVTNSTFPKINSTEKHNKCIQFSFHLFSLIQKRKIGF